MKNKTTKRIKKQFLKELNNEIKMQFLTGDNEAFFKEWNDDVSNIWIKRIESS